MGEYTGVYLPDGTFIEFANPETIPTIGPAGSNECLYVVEGECDQVLVLFPGPSRNLILLVVYDLGDDGTYEVSFRLTLAPGADTDGTKCSCKTTSSSWSDFYSDADIVDCVFNVGLFQRVTATLNPSASDC